MFQKNAFLLCKFKSVKVKPLEFQVPIDEKFHAVPHLKALTNGIDPSSGQRDDSLYIKRLCTWRKSDFST